ncbi:hypothetical protein E1A91_A02G144100v1 [Gossypium mustelinum]|uniref:Uncharacterized protein n=1 Tax=Gossypium mustelinum TaxID=34275 RepID=A0A5D3A592_GOSMU|nr:hypothetical protein E1A91_A02G144100v1 [Gossypium mustelinum]
MPLLLFWMAMQFQLMITDQPAILWELVVIPKYCRCESQKLSGRGVVGFQCLLTVRL